MATTFDATVRTEAALQGAIEKFDVGLSECEPLFDTLAAHIDVAAAERDWQMLIGEDCSGRPVTRFVGNILRGVGVEVPTFNICTSESTRRTLGVDPYVDHVRQIADANGHPTRVLVASEKLTTGATANFLSGVLRHTFDSVDFAILTSRYSPVPEVDADRLFLGGVACGIGENEAVYKTFEGIVDIDTPEAERWRQILRSTPEEDIPALFQRHHIRTSTSYPLHGLIASQIAPIAVQMEDPFYQPLIDHVAQSMDRLSADYLQRRALLKRG